MSLESLRSRTRLELGDTEKVFQATTIGDGTFGRFKLPAKNVDDVTVYQSGVQIYEGEDYTLDRKHGTVHLNDPLPEEEVLTVEGSSFSFFTNDKIDLFISSALAKHNHDRPDGPVEIDTLEEVEEHAVAILSAIEGLWVLITDSSHDVDIYAASGMNVPRSQRVRQLHALVEQKQDAYNKLAFNLNVGIESITMGTLRRVSRMTGRLVPVHRPQEVEDPTPPTRIYPPIDLIGPTREVEEDEV